MGTSPQIPTSNRAGNNQTTFGGQSGNLNARPMAVPGANPSTSRTTGTIPFAGTPAPTASSNGFITSGTSGATNNLDKQLTDIWGKGVGGSLFSLLQGMSGTDSTILQEYIQSLQPQFAQNQANLNATMGAQGVSGNSSVAAIANSNLASQQNALIAGESAQLTQSQEQLTAQLLSGMEGSAAKEVSTSGWTVFGDVMGSIAQDAGAVLHGGAAAMPGSGSASSGNIPASSVLQNAQSYDLGASSPIQTQGDIIPVDQATIGA